MTPRDIACQELVEVVTEYVEGALPPDEVAVVEQHLVDCAALRYLRQMRATVTALGMVHTEHITETHALGAACRSTGGARRCRASR